MKIIKIESCDKCPALKKGYNVRQSNSRYKRLEKTCTIKNKILTRTFKIPDWCPLEDYKEIASKHGISIDEAVCAIHTLSDIGKGIDKDEIKKLLKKYLNNEIIHPKNKEKPIR